MQELLKLLDPSADLYEFANASTFQVSLEARQRMIPRQPNEAATLRAMLGLPDAKPVYLDIKPGPLTAGEWRLFAERLVEITRQTTDSAAV